MTARMLRLAALACGLLASAPLIAGPAPAPAAFEYAAGSGVLTVSGHMGPGFSDRLREAMDRHPRARVVAIDSPGGFRYHAFRSADLLNARGVPVRIDGRCASACALLWAMADRREITPGSRVGLHGSRFRPPVPVPGVVVRTITAVNDRVTAGILRRAGFPEEVVLQGDRTPPTTMSWFRAEDLRSGRLAFRFADAPAVPGAADPAGQDTGAAASGGIAALAGGTESMEHADQAPSPGL